MFGLSPPFQRKEGDIVRHLIDFDQMTLPEWQALYELGLRMRERPGDFAQSCAGKLVATLFYEPSTRTQLSFQAAALRLGAQVIGFSGTGGSSVAKGENLKDTVRTVANYVDAIVMRHPQEGAALAASLFSEVPVVNAGDGGHLHPTQTLTDLFTISLEKGRLSGLTVGICGDLLNGRTVHSLIKALVRFPGNRFVLISTPALRIPDYVRAVLQQTGTPFCEADTLEEAVGGLDILYMTRIQRERFESRQAYEREAGVYVLDAAKLALARQDLLVLHPLPKVDEITHEADADPRCRYFEQARNGMFIRMALLHTLLQQGRQTPPPPAHGAGRCTNPRCVTAAEPYLPALSHGTHCLYCDKETVL